MEVKLKARFATVTNSLSARVITCYHESMIFIVEDDELMAECLKNTLSHFTARQDIQLFTNAIDAMQAMSDGLPDLIFLDVLLDGPDGFTFLHELVSYPDTSAIPIVLVTSLALQRCNFDAYGVKYILDKTTMTPADIRDCVQELL